MPDPTGRVSHLPHFHRGVAWKEPVRVATTANITIATALNNGDSLDGVTLATGDRVLVKDQSTGSQNGIYVVGASPSRAYDMDQDGTTTVPAEEVMGAFIYVIAGTANGGKVFYNTNTSAPTLGTTALTFTEFSAGGGGGAPTNADYLVGTANGSLSNEIVVGTSPGGELGGTWASPTVDTTHSGSSHAGVISTHEAAADPHTGYLKEADIAAKGDLYVGTANDTVGILSVGSNDQIPMADSGQSTGIKWVGSQTPSTQNYSDSAAEGTADTYARGDHKHAMPAASGAVAGLNWIASSADEDATNVQNQDHTEFQFAVVAGRWYVVQCFFLTSANNATADFEYRLAVTAGTMEGRGHSGQQDSGLTFAMTGIATTGAAQLGNITVGTAASADLGFPGVATLYFAFRHNTTNGTCKVQFGNNSTGVGRTSRMMKGSMFGWKEIS